MQEWYLGRQKVSLLERCPQFRGVLIEGFHCSYGSLVMLWERMMGKIWCTAEVHDKVMYTIRQ